MLDFLSFFENENVFITISNIFFLIKFFDKFEFTRDNWFISIL